MPRCGAPLPGYVDKPLPNGLCLWIKPNDPRLTAQEFCQGQFCSTNPAATATRIFTDAEGRVTGEWWQAYGPRAPLVFCLSNCGKGTGFFGLGGKAAEYGRQVAGIVGQLAMSLTPLAPFVAVGSALSESVEGSQKGMSLNIGGILGAAGSVLGGANLGQFTDITRLLGGGLQIAGAAFAPQPASNPIYLPQQTPMVIQTAAPARQAAQAAGAVIGGAGMAIVSKQAIQILLQKIAAQLGRKGITLSKAVDMARKLGKFFTSPEAIATYMGIAVGELALLITAHSARKRRRMNPANAHALRRAARRIKSFHRMCTHTDLIKTRRSASRGGCFKCGKRKCAC